MHLIIGLGNIGREYETTRHNYGFLLLDKLIAEHGFEAKGVKFKSEMFFGKINDFKVIAIKPQTFMNLSGMAAREIVNFYKIPVENILVLHDDVDLEFAKIKCKIGGGNGGHNGLKSLDENLGKNYMRLRLGVGRPENRDFTTSDYVLGKFTKDEIKSLEFINKKISDLIELILAGKGDEFSNRFYLK